jgi:multidrug efflux system outer membrane protein
MLSIKSKIVLSAIGLSTAIYSCNVPKLVTKAEDRKVPQSFAGTDDTTAQPLPAWRTFFTDPQLVALIDAAIANNQDLQMTLQEIEIARSDIRLRRAAYLPNVDVGIGAGVDKVARYTPRGAADEMSEITPGKKVPNPIADLNVIARASWEVDIWKKLRNKKQAAVNRYLATIDGKNFVLTNLIAEVADTYYELVALDNQLDIVRQNIKLQQNGLEIVKAQKEAARATELAVKKFQAEVLHSQSLEYDFKQQIAVAQNRLYLLLGRYPDKIERTKADFFNAVAPSIYSGIPTALLSNRPDVQQAEHELKASKLDVRAARAEFFPSLSINAGVGLQAFNPRYLATLPESLLGSLVGDLAGPLINRNAIKAEYFSAGARQVKAVYNYQRSILNAYLEVSTDLSNINNLEESYALKSKQVEALASSIDIAGDLFKSARADYLEVLTTQRDVLEAKLELAEIKRAQLQSVVHVYRDLGGGWQ